MKRTRPRDRVITTQRGAFKISTKGKQSMKKYILSLLTLIMCSSAAAQEINITVPSGQWGAGPQNKVHCPAGSVYKWDDWIEGLVRQQLDGGSIRLESVCSLNIERTAWNKCEQSCWDVQRRVEAVVVDRSSYVEESTVSDLGVPITMCGTEVLCCCKGQTMTSPWPWPFN